MLSPSEGKEIYERIMAKHEAGLAVSPEDTAALMQAAESGYAPAQRAYANVINNVEGNLLAALPWYCKAMQQGDAEARTTLSELYAAEPLVRGQVGQYLPVEHLIELRRRLHGGRPAEGGDQQKNSRLETALSCLLFIAVVLWALWRHVMG